MTVFRVFRRLLATLEQLSSNVQSLTVVVLELVRAHQALGAANERLEALELSRHQWEAMCEGLLQKAEGKLRAANNAEARERANKKSYEHLVDAFPEDGETEEAARNAVHFDHAAPSEADKVLGMRMAVASTPKARALSAKWGR